MVFVVCLFVLVLEVAELAQGSATKEGVAVSLVGSCIPADLVAYRLEDAAGERLEARIELLGRH